MLSQFSLSQLTVDHLITQRPDELADLVLAAKVRVNINFDPVLARLETGGCLAC